MGACLDGNLLPVGINQSASLQFSPVALEQQLLFHADAGDTIDVEVRPWENDGGRKLAFSLRAPDETELARATAADSRASDGRLYPLAAVQLQRAGMYVLAMHAADLDDNWRIRVRVRDAQPLPAEDSAASLSRAVFASLTDIVSDLGPPIGLLEGNRAPDFTIRTLDGERLQLADLRGKIVLLNFWGTWCGPCRREMPEFQKVYEEWAGRGLEILAIAYNDSEAAMADFRAEYGLTFPLALDASGAINDAYAVQTRPSSYLLDADGLILMRHFGLMSQAQLDELLTAALAAG